MTRTMCLSLIFFGAAASCTLGKAADSLAAGSSLPSRLPEVRRGIVFAEHRSRQDSFLFCGSSLFDMGRKKKQMFFMFVQSFTMRTFVLRLEKAQKSPIALFD